MRVARHTRLGLVLTIAFWMAALAPAAAQSLFERLVLPGDLIEGHADLQKNCDNCHTSFSKGAQASLCLDCHKPVAQDLRAGLGLHGRAPEVAANDCSHCHTDHIGRDADIAPLDRELFDHTRTELVLEGAHLTVPCADCHAPERKFREAPSRCIGCHREDDAHAGTFGTDCATCHTASAWGQTRTFDHSKTQFPLQDTHEKVPCASCHTGEKGEELPLDCVGCHAIQDVHRQAMGNKCDTCHSPGKWTDVRFEHDRDTGFALTGQHRENACDSCHVANAYETTLGNGCIDCHKKDNPHGEKLGERCETCHQPTGWLRDVAFDHDLTRFPLIGQHVLAACEECHLDSSFTDTETTCVSCHAKEDKHRGALGRDCETCHNPNGWAFWIFDHDRQTRYRLTGKHAGLECDTCHTPQRPDPAKTPRACVACHARDDVHKGQFGTRCDACHGTGTFKNARLR